MQLKEEHLRSLLIRGLVGDAPAYHPFLGDLSAHLRTFLRSRLVQRPEEVEDLVQELLLAIHNQRHTYDCDQPLTAWVHAIARSTRANDAYVTIAHADEISLVRHDAVLTVTGSGTQHAPCWVALDGPFLFSANSPSRTVSRYAVYGERIIQDAAIVTTFGGNSTDITCRAGSAAVIDGDGTNSHVSVFKVDGNGNFSLNGLATINGAATNGIAIVRLDENGDD
jgi:hypothetical protein